MIWVQKYVATCTETFPINPQYSGTNLHTAGLTTFRETISYSFRHHNSLGLFLCQHYPPIHIRVFQVVFSLGSSTKNYVHKWNVEQKMDFYMQWQCMFHRETTQQQTFCLQNFYTWVVRTIHAKFDSHARVGRVVQPPWAVQSKCWQNGQQNYYFKYQNLIFHTQNVLNYCEKINILNKHWLFLKYIVCVGRPLLLLALGVKKPSTSLHSSYVSK